MKRVVVIDYGLGNLHSVLKALAHEGGEAVLSSDPDDVRNAERLVLPGVGAFEDGMSGLRQRNLVEPLREFAECGRPLLGICLGMQLLLGGSDEFGWHPGLGIIPGKVILIERGPGRKVPHVGWNGIAAPQGISWAGTPLEKLPEGAMMYFVHSFTAVPDDEGHRLADADYAGARISAVVRKGNVFGSQFHPEKSGAAGLALLAHFLA